MEPTNRSHPIFWSLGGHLEKPACFFSLSICRVLQCVAVCCSQRGCLSFYLYVSEAVYLSVSVCLCLCLCLCLTPYLSLSLPPPLKHNIQIQLLASHAHLSECAW